MKTQEEILSPIIGKTEIRGKYDVLHFLLFCKPVNQDSVSTLSFSPVNEDYATSRTFFWVKVKTRKWVYVRLPLLAFGISTLIASQQFFNLPASQTIDVGALMFGVIGAIGETVSLMYGRK